MSEPFRFESDAVQRVRGTPVAVVAAVAWGSWAAAFLLGSTVLGVPALATLVYFFGPSLWYVAARRWRQPPASHGSVEWSGDALSVVSGPLDLTAQRSEVTGAALFPDGQVAVRLSLADDTELRLAVPDLATGERLLAALGCDERSRPYTFVGELRQRAVSVAHRGVYAGMALAGALVFSGALGDRVNLARAVLVLAPLLALPIAYRAGLRSALRLGADGLLVLAPAPRFVPLASIAGMRSADGTLVLTLADRSAVFLHGTAAHDDEATAAAVTRRLWSLQQGERTDPETAAALSAGGERHAGDAPYRRMLSGGALRVALHDVALPLALRKEAARRLLAEGADGAQAAREAAKAWADEAARREFEGAAAP